MTRKDYVMVSAAIKSARASELPANGNMDIYNNNILDNAARLIAHKLQIDNIRFDCSKFLEACGVKPCTHQI